LSGHQATFILKISAIADDLVAFGANNGWSHDVLAYARQYAEKVGHDYAQFIQEMSGEHRKPIA